MTVLVYAESTEGKFKKSALEAVEYARQCADKTGDKVTVVCASDKVPGEEILKDLGKNGASKLIRANVQDKSPVAIASAIAEAAKKENATLLIVSGNYTGKAVAPLLAIQTGAGIVTGVISVPESANPLKVRKTVFSNKAFAEVELGNGTNVIGIIPNSFAVTGSYSGDVDIEDLSPAAISSGITTIEVSTVKGKVPLTEAERVVSGGRGMKGPENWGMIEELAEALGAATACSKPVADMDWRPHEEHVGQTGITIKPNLYIAVGISGAIQHLAGVSSSKVIVAINKDPEAPFFKVADYGIVGDAFEVLPKLIEAARELKSAQ